MMVHPAVFLWVMLYSFLVDGYDHFRGICCPTEIFGTYLLNYMASCTRRG